MRSNVSTKKPDGVIERLFIERRDLHETIGSISDIQQVGLSRLERMLYHVGLQTDKIYMLYAKLKPALHIQLEKELRDSATINNFFEEINSQKPNLSLKAYSNYKNIQAMKSRVDSIFATINKLLPMVYDFLDQCLERVTYLIACKDKLRFIYELIHHTLRSHPQFWQQFCHETYFKIPLGGYEAAFLISSNNAMHQVIYKVPYCIAQMLAIIPANISQVSEDDSKKHLTQICQVSIAARESWGYAMGGPDEFYQLILQLHREAPNFNDPIALDLIRNSLLEFEKKTILPFQINLEIKTKRLAEKLLSSTPRPNNSSNSWFKWGGFSYLWPCPPTNTNQACQAIDTEFHRYLSDSDESDDEVSDCQALLSFVNEAYGINVPKDSAREASSRWNARLFKPPTIVKPVPTASDEEVNAQLAEFYKKLSLGQ